MLDKIIAFLKKAAEPGLYVPLVYNPVTKKPSVTLMFAYITFILAIGSTILLHFKTDLMVATVTSICFWALAVIFYRLGKLDKAKIDLNNKSLELDSEDEEESNKKEENEE